MKCLLNLRKALCSFWEVGWIFGEKFLSFQGRFLEGFLKSLISFLNYLKICLNFLEGLLIFVIRYLSFLGSFTKFNERFLSFLENSLNFLGTSKKVSRSWNNLELPENFLKFCFVVSWTIWEFFWISDCRNGCIAFNYAALWSECFIYSFRLNEILVWTIMKSFPKFLGILLNFLKNVPAFS